MLSADPQPRLADLELRGLPACLRRRAADDQGPESDTLEDLRVGPAALSRGARALDALRDLDAIGPQRSFFDMAGLQETLELLLVELHTPTGQLVLEFLAIERSSPGNHLEE